MSDNARTWLAVAYVPAATSTAPFCGLTGIGTGAPGVTIIQGFHNWFYYLIAVW